MDYALSVDKVEEITGLDFFSNMMTAQMQELTESTFSTSAWPVSADKFQQRVRKWNKQ